MVLCCQLVVVLQGEEKNRQTERAERGLADLRPGAHFHCGYTFIALESLLTGYIYGRSVVLDYWRCVTFFPCTPKQTVSKKVHCLSIICELLTESKKSRSGGPFLFFGGGGGGGVNSKIKN